MFKRKNKSLCDSELGMHNALIFILGRIHCNLSSNSQKDSRDLEKPKTRISVPIESMAWSGKPYRKKCFSKDLAGDFHENIFGVKISLKKY